MYTMQERVVRTRAAVLSILFFVGIGAFAALPEPPHKDGRVSFLNVGQGDAIFVETPDGVQVLIDGGPDDTVVRALGEVMDPRDRSIDMVVGTHPDADHVGGLSRVLARYTVGSVLMTENEGTSEAWKRFKEAALAEGSPVLYARYGQLFVLGASTTLRVLLPDRNPGNFESNASSIVLQLRYGSSTFLFTGDAPRAIEEYLIDRDGSTLKSTVLKVGHHGSRTSTSKLFLDEVNPAFAVISSGKNNRYGHPHREVIELLRKRGITTLNTAASGTITFTSDGTQVQVMQ